MRKLALPEEILLSIQQPARYIGGEVNMVKKDPSAVDVRFAMCFPDVYDIGMSHLGIQILYDMFNKYEDVYCERVYSPWTDLDKIMREKHIPLFALESQDPVKEFDFLGITLQYEMCYTNILQVLELSGIPLHAEDRTWDDPVVIGGGPCSYNPEPIAVFFDMFYIGEGEVSYRQLLDVYKESRKNGDSRQEFLRKAAGIPGIYVPSLYEVTYEEDGTIRSFLPTAPGVPEKVTKRIVLDLDGAPYPTNPVVPSTEVVHDRVNLELFRGCVRGCRFCQAGHIYRPIRAKKPETLIRQGIETLKNTGHQDVTLLSLSTSDYRPLEQLCDGLLEYCESRSIGLSLPSLRADNFSMELMEKLQKVRKSGLTFAVEGGSQRLRDAINKNVTEEDLLNTCAIAFAGGWNNVKLYYMLGLPTETDEDIVGIAEMANQVLHCWRQNARNKNRGVKITISTSCFIPKPHSPFQWEEQISKEEYLRRVNLLRSSLTARNVTYNWHDAETSVIEAALSRGDRRLGAVIEEVWRQGGRLEAWSDYFSYSRWEDAFGKCGLDMEFYASRERSIDELLPWDMIDVGVRKAHLVHEREQCYASRLSPDCRKQCSACGVARLMRGGKCDG